jgi:hypothetical protein
MSRFDRQSGYFFETLFTKGILSWRISGEQSSQITPPVLSGNVLDRPL